MKVLVTGGAGFIGSALCRFLVSEKRWHVLNVDKLTYAGTRSSLAGIEENALYRFVRADICDRVHMASLFQSFAPNAVLHLAAESHVDRSISGPAAFVQTNIVGTYTLLECAREYWMRLPSTQRAAFRFLHVSTDEVYGSLGPSGAFVEASPYAPRSPYSASKASGDHLARAWHATYGLPVLVSHGSNNYGSYQFPEKLIPRMILSALAQQSLPIYGSGQQVRDWLHVHDHVRALVRILEAGRIGESYHVGGKNERANRAVVEEICSILDAWAPRGAGLRYGDLIAFVADRPGHDFRYAIDASKLEGELGWSARTDFSKGLQETVRWYLDNEAWWRPLLKKDWM